MTFGVSLRQSGASPYPPPLCLPSRVREHLPRVQAQWTRLQESAAWVQQLLASLQLQGRGRPRRQRKALPPLPTDLGLRRQLEPLWHVACSSQPTTATAAPWAQPATAPPGTSSSTRRPLQVKRELLSSRPRAQEDTQAGLQGLSSKWEELNRARQQDQLLGLLQEAKEKMEQLEGALQSAEMGQDLGSSRGLQKRHHQLEA
ncbi:hypothetical protein J1605_015054 [Eschrichtius robustus]|uniref:Uncharacterized protein n=1 Tax=Eschrichtius robustus TaxID=9764 RepID=A0AB34GC24_ESCRO|nr:hypothetical protein J1605_015054 [Eschrichtius robustus]